MKKRLKCLPLLTMPLLLTLLLDACAPFDWSKRVDLLGDPAPVAAATRTITITPSTDHVNVTGGEVVKFAVGANSFAWNFDGEEYPPAFDLTLAAPPGLLDHPVIAYVAPNPLYMGDGDGRGHGGGHGGHH